MMIDYRPLLERFWEKVDKSGPNGCWIWLGSLVHGHGQFGIGGNKKKYAHVFSWELVHGSVPLGKELAHTACHNPPCVNPDHVEPLTRWEHVRKDKEYARKQTKVFLPHIAGR